MEPASLQSLMEAVQSLRAELERARSEQAHWSERSQAQDAEVARLKDALASAEQVRKAIEGVFRAREAELGRELDDSVRRERLLREKFEEELRKAARMRAAAEAESRELLSLKEKELASLIETQRELSSQQRQERRRLEELVTGYQGELGRLRAVLEALDDKLTREAAAGQADERERKALEQLASALIQQNSRLQGSLENLFQGKQRSRDDSAADVQAALEKFRWEVRQLELRLSDQTSATQKALIEADALRNRLDREIDARRAAESKAAESGRSFEDERKRAEALHDQLAAEKPARALAEASAARGDEQVRALEVRLAALQQEVSAARSAADEELRNQRMVYESRLRQVRGQLEDAYKRLAASRGSTRAPAASAAHAETGVWAKLSGLLAGGGEGTPAGATSAKQSVLVIGDDPAFAPLLAAALAGAGYEVASAADGEQAQQAAEKRPKVVVSDFEVAPWGKGADVYRALRGLPALKDAPIVFVSSLTPDDSKRQLPADPKVRVVPKPVDFQKLEQIVAALLA